MPIERLVQDTQEIPGIRVLSPSHSHSVQNTTKAVYPLKKQSQERSTMSRPFNHQDSGNIRNDGTVTAAGKGQVCIPTVEKNMQFKKLKAISANQVCFDCPAPRPTWASVTYGKKTCTRAKDTCLCLHPGLYLSHIHSATIDRCISVFGLLRNTSFHGCTYHFRAQCRFG